MKYDYNRLKPYVTISWSGWLSKEKGAERIEPNEERFIKFNFAEAPLSWGASIYTGNPADYLGYDSIKTTPLKRLHFPSVQFFCKRDSNDRICELRDEVKNGLVKITIRFGTKAKQVELVKLQKFRIITKATWDEVDSKKIYFIPDY